MLLRLYRYRPCVLVFNTCNVSNALVNSIIKHIEQFLLEFKVVWIITSEHRTQEKKLKNWYIQEYTTETTFEPNLKKKRYEEVMKPTMVDFNNKVLNDYLIDMII